MSQHLQERTVAACVSLSDALPERIYWPNTTAYLNESHSMLALILVCFFSSRTQFHAPGNHLGLYCFPTLCHS